MRFKSIPKGVVLLGLASLLSDVASESIYPLLPIFLTEVVGAGVLFVGLIEGVAESVASLTKFFAGYFSDRIKKREPFVLFGYGLAGVVRPLMGFVTAPWQALVIRFTDRVGKGIRTAPRDAWLGGMASPDNRGQIFGFHRAMDHAGATLGPLLAMGFLFFFPAQYRPLFLLALIPGVLSALCIVWAEKVQPPPAGSGNASKPLLSLREAVVMPGAFKRYLGVLLLFTLGNSSDAFILLRLKNIGVRDALIPALWALLHVVKMTTSYWGGGLSDRIGRKTAITAGWLVYAVIYLLFGYLDHAGTLIAAFLVYGVYYGLTEGVEKALVTDLIHENQRGTAFGFYNLIIGIGALPASLIFGYIAQTYSFTRAFEFGALLAAAASILLWWAVPAERPDAAK